MNFVKKLIRFCTIMACSIIGLILLLIIWGEVSMISHSFIETELEKMGLYEDLPDFPEYKISGFRHKWIKSRYDYKLKLKRPMSLESIAKIDSLCRTYEGHLRWHYDDNLYTLFLWDIAEDYNDFLMIVPGKKTVMFVYEPMSRLKFKENEDLFHGPIYGEEIFHEHLMNSPNE